MKITTKWLQEKSACPQGIEWFKAHHEMRPVPLLRSLIKADKLQWANWLVARVMDKPQRVQYAIFAAEQVIGIFEKKYPQDKRPRQAIEAAKAWLKNPTNENQKSAAADASAASAASAADAASAASVAYAASAASAAAYAAASAAYAAAVDTASAAYAASAASAYAKKKIQLKILEFGIEILQKPEKEPKP
jgi:hypothetical protein